MERRIPSSPSGVAVVLAQRRVEDLLEMEGLGPAWWRDTNNLWGRDVLFNLQHRWGFFQRRTLA